MTAPTYLLFRDVTYSETLWPPDVRVLEAMWALEPRRPLYGLASWERTR